MRAMLAWSTMRNFDRSGRYAHHASFWLRSIEYITLCVKLGIMMTAVSIVHISPLLKDLRFDMYGLKTHAAFDSAHFLADYYGKCENLHGHEWHVTVELAQEELQTEGTMRDMVLDFGVFKKAVRAIADSLDHTFLVEDGTLKPETIAALESEGFTLTILPFRTTAENLARYIFDKLEEQGFPVAEVEVDETPNNRAYYRK